MSLNDREEELLPIRSIVSQSRLGQKGRLLDTETCTLAAVPSQDSGCRWGSDGISSYQLNLSHCQVRVGVGGAHVSK
jgi:hypothetical protein